MLACKGIFTQPSIMQACTARKRQSRKDLHRKAFCIYYTINKTSSKYNNLTKLHLHFTTKSTDVDKIYFEITRGFILLLYNIKRLTPSLQASTADRLRRSFAQDDSVTAFVL